MSAERVEQIEKEIRKIQETLQARDDEFFKKSNGSFELYQDLREPFTSKMDKLDRERRMIMTPEFEREIPDYGDVMPLSDFVECCKDGGFIDYDGSGNYVKDNKISNISIYPSDVENNSVRKDFDTIIWFNR